jgi:CspA family cold shock protein
MPRGTVKYFWSDKGYGFIAPDNGHLDVFIHVNALKQTGLASLATGQIVAFDVEHDTQTGRPRAVNVHIVQ